MDESNKPQVDEIDEFDDGTILKVKPMLLDALLAKEFSDDIWLVEGLVPIGGLTIISADPGSFKTWVLLDTAISVASGQKLFGEFQAKQTGVLIIDEENGERLLQQRLLKLGADPELPIRVLPDVGFKTSPDPIKEVIDYCKLYDIGFVTFDSLVRIHNANENDAMEMAKVFRDIRELPKEGITVLITHHNRKTSGGNPAQDMRGSSDILAALDCHIALSKDKDESNQLLMSQTKVRLAEELPAFELEVQSDGDTVKIRHVGKHVSESKRDLAYRIAKGLIKRDGGLNQRQILGQLKDLDININARTLRDILQKMESAGEIVSARGKRNSIIYQIKESPSTDE